MFLAIMGAIFLWFNAMDNVLVHASGNPPADKIEDRITFTLSHALLYLSESNNEQNNKSADVNKFNIFCGDGGSSSSLSAISVSVSPTYDVVCCWIFTSDIFLPNDPLPSDDMVDWENDSMLVIGGGYINID